MTLQKSAMMAFIALMALAVLAAGTSAFSTVDYVIYADGADFQESKNLPMVNYAITSNDCITSSDDDDFFAQHYRRIGVMARYEREKEKEEFQRNKERRNWIIVDGNSEYLGDKGYRDYLRDAEDDDSSLFAVTDLNELKKGHNRITFIRDSQPERHCEGCRYGNGDRIE